MKNWIFRVIGEGIEPTNEQIAKFVEDFSNYTVDVGDVPTAILERIKRPYTPEDIKTTIKQIVIKYFDVTIKKVLCVKAEEESIRSFLYDFLRVSMRLFVREFVDSVAAYFVGGVEPLTGPFADGFGVSAHPAVSASTLLWLSAMFLPFLLLEFSNGLALQSQEIVWKTTDSNLPQ